MQEDLQGFADRNAQVVAIGQGTGEQAAHYCGESGVRFPCVGDPEKSGYRSQGLERGSWWSVMIKDLLTHPSESISLIREADLEAARLRASDPLQLGGVAIIDPSGRVRYRHVAKRTDDIPSNAEVFAALDAMEAL